MLLRMRVPPVMDTSVFRVPQLEQLMMTPLRMRVVSWLSVLATAVIVQQARTPIARSIHGHAFLKLCHASDSEVTAVVVVTSLKDVQLTSRPALHRLLMICKAYEACELLANIWVSGDPRSHVCQAPGALICVSPCGSILGPFWVHSGSILGPFWVHSGSILGPFWVHSGSILGPFWVHSGSILGPFWVHSGSILGPFWVHSGSILGPFWVHSGSILGPFWVHFV